MKNFMRYSDIRQWSPFFQNVPIGTPIIYVIKNSFLNFLSIKSHQPFFIVQFMTISELKFCSRIVLYIYTHFFFCLLVVNICDLFYFVSAHWYQWHTGKGDTHTHTPHSVYACLRKWATACLISTIMFNLIFILCRHSVVSISFNII